MKNHIFSRNNSKARIARKVAWELDIVDYLTKCDKEEQPAGMFVSMEERAY